MLDTSWPNLAGYFELNAGELLRQAGGHLRGRRTGLAGLLACAPHYHDTIIERQRALDWCRIPVQPTNSSLSNAKRK